MAETILRPHITVNNNNVCQWKQSDCGARDSRSLMRWSNWRQVYPFPTSSHSNFSYAWRI